MPDVRAATLPGTPGRPNEDAYAILPDLAVVADGATSPPRLGDGCQHGPAWYAHRLVANLIGAHVEDTTAAPAYLLAEAITRTTAAHADTCDVTHPGTPSATVAMLQIGADATIRWLVLGDSTLLLDTAGELTVITDDRLSNSSVEERAAVLAGDASLDAAEHERRIAALVRAQRSHRNRPGGFWVAATDPQAAHEAYTGTAAAGTVGLRRAALLTDGAARVVDLYGTHTWAELLDRLEGDGPAQVLRELRETEHADRNGTRYPRTKKSDDATAVLLDWTGEPR